MKNDLSETQNVRSGHSDIDLTASREEDITRLLHQIEVDEAYKNGWAEALASQTQGTHEEAFEKIQKFASQYYFFLKNSAKNFLLSDVKIEQFRAGLDPDTNVPSILLIISKEQKDLLPNLMDLARSIEAGLWESEGLHIHIWTLTNTRLDEEKVARDYPFFFKPE